MPLTLLQDYTGRLLIYMYNVFCIVLGKSNVVTFCVTVNNGCGSLAQS